jgi:hypothetical protein
MIIREVAQAPNLLLLQMKTVQISQDFVTISTAKFPHTVTETMVGVVILETRVKLIKVRRHPVFICIV